MIFKVMKGEPLDLEYLRYPGLVSAKLNGVRGYIRDGVVYSTSNKPLPNKHLQKAFGQYGFLDGEFIVGDPADTRRSLNRTTSVVMSDDKPIDGLKFYAFDYIANLAMPFAKREVTKNMIVKAAKSKLLVAVPHYAVKDEATLLWHERTFLGQGYEGLIWRDPEAAYKCGKSTAKQAFMTKLKRFVDDEAEIIGFEEQMHNTNEATISETGRTKRSSAKAGKVGKATLGALVVRTPKGVVFNIGTGFSDDLRATIWANREAYRGRLAKYKYFEIGSEDVPVLPVFLDIRDERDL